MGNENYGLAAEEADTAKKSEKTIHIYYVNRLKLIDGKIFDEEDQDCPRRIVQESLWRWRDHWLDEAGIKDPALRREVLDSIQWCDECVPILESKGWTVLKGPMKPTEKGKCAGGRRE